MPNHRDCRGLVGSDKSLGGASCTARQTAPVAACRPPDPERNLPENAARRLMCSPEVREKSVAVLRGVLASGSCHRDDCRGLQRGQAASRPQSENSDREVGPGRANDGGALSVAVRRLLREYSRTPAVAAA